MRSELKSGDVKVNLSTDSHIFFQSIVFHMYYGQSFFHQCGSLGFGDILLFLLDLLPYSHEDVCKGDFYGAIFLVIIAVLLCCRELRTGVTSYLINFLMILNCITKPHACSQIYLH